MYLISSITIVTSQGKLCSFNKLQDNDVFFNSREQPFSFALEQEICLFLFGLLFQTMKFDLLKVQSIFELTRFVTKNFLVPLGNHGSMVIKVLQLFFIIFCTCNRQEILPWYCVKKYLNHNKLLLCLPIFLSKSQFFCQY